MVFVGFLDWAVFVFAAFGAAGIALYAVTAVDLRGRAARRSLLEQQEDRTVFLLDDGGVVDATPEARHFLSAAPPGEGDWRRLFSLLAPSFPGIETELAALEETGLLSRASATGDIHLRAELRGDLVRLTLSDPDISGESADIDMQSLAAMERELETLRTIADETAFLMWRQDADGQVSWVNRAYLDTVARLHGTAATEIWPPRTLFEATFQGHGSFTGSRRVQIAGRSDTTDGWYELRAMPVGSDVLVTAVDADATVSAEAQLRAFMQTLTKTFAHLTTGLAVFDRARRLVLFNPALTELTGLPIDFLTGRPTLFGFLDKLRERNMIPEPKDYKSWRRQIVDLEAAAADGSYEETWSLSSGRTYRVAGRPHPDGAVAFLIEDISAKVALTRRFRAEQQLGQSVLDCIDEAIAVFSSNGVLVMSNDAYNELWGTAPDTGLDDISVLDATRTWMDQSLPTPIWSDFRDYVTETSDRAEWSAEVRLKDGRGLACRFVPVAGGATLAQFRRSPAGPSPSLSVEQAAG